MTTILERFWPKVVKTDNCWIWKGCLIPGGYGQIWLNNRMVNAHRVAWEITYGHIPERLYVLHSCDNPPCIRPNHLFLGTQAENQQDSISKGRFARGGKNGQAKLTISKVNEIKISKLSQRKLANQFHVSRRTITDILKGRSWKWV